MWNRLAVCTKCSRLPTCRSSCLFRYQTARIPHQSHNSRQLTLVRSLLLALSPVLIMLPSIICATLLGLASPVLSRPVVPSTNGAYSVRRSLNKRAPQGPKIGGANFPGKVEKETSIRSEFNVFIQIPQSLELMTAGMHLQQGP